MGPLVRRATPPSRGNGSRGARYEDTDPLNSDAPGESSAELPSVGTRAASTSRARRSDPAGEIRDIVTPRLLALNGPTAAPAFRRVAGLVSGANVSRVLSRGFKCALLISKVR